MPPRSGITGPAMSLVIADVSGLHARGLAKQGTMRHTLVLTNDAGGLPRVNPFSYELDAATCDVQSQSQKMK